MLINTIPLFISANVCTYLIQARRGSIQVVMKSNRLNLFTGPNDLEQRQNFQQQIQILQGCLFTTSHSTWLGLQNSKVTPQPQFFREK